MFNNDLEDEAVTKVIGMFCICKYCETMITVEFPADFDPELASKIASNVLRSHLEDDCIEDNRKVK